MFQRFCFAILYQRNLSISNRYRFPLTVFTTKLGWTFIRYYEWENFLKRIQWAEEIFAIFEILYFNFFRKITFWSEICKKRPKYKCTVLLIALSSPHCVSRIFSGRGVRGSRGESDKSLFSGGSLFHVQLKKVIHFYCSRTTGVTFFRDHFFSLHLYKEKFRFQIFSKLRQNLSNFY